MILRPVHSYVLIYLIVLIAIFNGEMSQADVIVVRQYDENIFNRNSVDLSATTLTHLQITSDVAAAFDGGRGGVIDFDNGSFTDPHTIYASFANGAKSLRLTNPVHDWEIGVTLGGISGPNVIFNGAPNPFPTPFANRIVFGDVTDLSGAILPERVSEFGFLVLDTGFNAASNQMEFLVTYSDGSIESLSHTIPLQQPGSDRFDTFFGFAASPGQFINQIHFTATNNLASDDWAFITTAVPEPNLLSAISSLTLLCCYRERTRFKKRRQLI